MSSLSLTTSHATHRHTPLETRRPALLPVLWRNFFCLFGFPAKLHAVRGRNFESAVVKELCKCTGITKTHTTPYHPRGNGTTERFNRTHMLETLEPHLKPRWHEYVDAMTHAYNCTRLSTGYTPYYLMFGRHPRLPVDLIFGLQTTREPCEYKSSKTGRSSSLGRRKTINSSRQQSPLAVKDGRTRAKKRQASPDMETPPQKVLKAEPCNTSQENVSMKRLKRKVWEDGDEKDNSLQEKRKRKRVFDLLDDKEAASSSTDTGRESINNPLEGCSTSLAVKGVKRKAATDREGPARKKKSPHLKQTKETEEVFTSSPRAVFEEKYQQENQLGKGGFGSVFAGYRKADHLPVAIKYIPKNKVVCKQTDKNGKQLSIEVAVMLKLQTASQGPSAPVSLLDWYDLKQELILVMERPVPAVDLYQYTDTQGGSLEEEEAKIILKQLLDATIDLEKNSIFHRDIKVENILIETSTNVPRVRLIDFGLSCFVKKRSSYSVFYGTSAHTPPEWYNGTYRAGPTTVWQLGIVLFETLHCSMFETRRFLRKKLKFSDKLSDDCQDFLRTCLNKIPEQRPTLRQLQQHPWLR